LEKNLGSRIMGCKCSGLGRKVPYEHSYGRILNANLGWTRKKSSSIDAKTFRPCLYLSFWYQKPNFKYSSFSFVRLCWG